MDARVKLPLSSRQTRLLALADYIENCNDHWDMSAWDSCAAGHCAHMNHARTHPRQFATMFLELDSEQAHDLFHPTFAQLGLEDIDPRHCDLRLVSRRWAASTLRYFAMTGKIDWKASKTGVNDLRIAPHEPRDYVPVSAPPQMGFIAIGSIVNTEFFSNIRRRQQQAHNENAPMPAVTVLEQVE